MKSQIITTVFIVIDIITFIIVASNVFKKYFNILGWVLSNTINKLIGLAVILILYEESGKRNQHFAEKHKYYKYFTVILFIIPLIVNIVNILYNITLINYTDSLFYDILVMSLPLELFIAQLFVSMTPTAKILYQNDYILVES